MLAQVAPALHRSPQEHPMLHSLVRTIALTTAALGAAMLIGVVQTAFISMPPVIGFTYELAIVLIAAAAWVRWQGARYTAASWRGGLSLRLITESSGCVIAISAAQHYWLKPGDVPEMVDLATRSLWGAASTLMLISLSAPLLEEALFRGWMLQELRKQFGARVSICVSAGAFALAHGDSSRAIGQLVGGVLLGAIVVHTGRLWLAVAAHSAANLGAAVEAIPLFTHLPQQLGLAYPLCCTMLSLLAAREVRRLLRHSAWTTPRDDCDATRQSGRRASALLGGGG
jgi:membrane protease YdiL (CAAX protease family)